MNQRSSDGGNEEGLKAIKTLTGVIYILQFLAFVTGGITLILAVVVNYLKRAKVEGTWLDSHFSWQINTFWFALGLFVVGGIAIPFGFGHIIVMGTALWLVYRIIRGWGRLNLNRPINEDEL